MKLGYTQAVNFYKRAVTKDGRVIASLRNHQGNISLSPRRMDQNRFVKPGNETICASKYIKYINK